MKKVTALILCGVLGFFLGAAALLGALRLCDDETRTVALGTSPDEGVSSTGITAEELTALGYKTVNCLRNGDYTGLAAITHPSFGVVFSPTLTVDLRTARCFTPQQVAKMAEDNSKYLWGTADSGPIELTVEDYVKTYVMTRDFSSTPVISINQPVRRSNSLDNTAECFPNCRYVEFCYPGTPENDYCDWSSLRLVFEEYDGEMKLTAVIHSEYTI